MDYESTSSQTSMAVPYIHSRRLRAGDGDFFVDRAALEHHRGSMGVSPWISMVV